MRAFSSNVKQLAPLAACLILGVTRISAATMVQLSLTDMISQSTAIEHAKVVSSWAALSGNIVYTHYKLQVSESMKGQASSEIVVFGGVAGGVRQVYAGTPQLNAGDDFVFFLWTNKAGLTHIVGLTQGLFAVAQNGSSDPGLTRSATHERILDPKSGRPVNDQTLTMKLSDLRTQIASVLSAAKVGQ